MFSIFRFVDVHRSIALCCETSVRPLSFDFTQNMSKTYTLFFVAFIFNTMKFVREFCTSTRYWKACCDVKDVIQCQQFITVHHFNLVKLKLCNLNDNENNLLGF